MHRTATGTEPAGRPASGDYAADYDTYISLVPEERVEALLVSENEATQRVLRDVSDTEALTHHGPYTWSIKEVVGHLADCERIFAYRALRFARGDQTPLAGFDENTYVAPSECDARSLRDLAEEYGSVRQASVALFAGLTVAAWSRSGIANGHPITVRALAYAIVGHERHHMGIVRRRLGLV